MKRILSLLLVCILCISLVACGNDNPVDGNKDNNNTNTEQSSNNEGTDKEPAYEIDKDLPGVVRVNLSTVKYCINAPGTLIKRANTGNIVELGSYFVIYDQYVDISSEGQFGVKLDAIKSAEDIINVMAEQMSATSLNGLIFADEYKVVAEKNETIKVNSWDMCKTTGKIELSCEYPLDYESVKFVAYSLIKDGFPIYFAVVENPAGEKPIDIGNMADKIAKTFREYSED